MPDPIEIHGPVGFWLPEEEALRRPILARISQAQTEGELPARTSGIPRESVAIWIKRGVGGSRRTESIFDFITVGDTIPIRIVRKGVGIQEEFEEV